MHTHSPQSSEVQAQQTHSQLVTDLCFTCLQPRLNGLNQILFTSFGYLIIGGVRRCQFYYLKGEWKCIFERHGVPFFPCGLIRFFS